MAKLVFLSGPAKGLSYVLSDVAMMGRQSNNEIPLQDLKASRQHAKIFYENGDYYIEDLHSRNGVLVNQNPIQKQKLVSNDTIQIGDTLMQVLELSLAPVENKSKSILSPSLQEEKSFQDVLATQPIETLVKAEKEILEKKSRTKEPKSFSKNSATFFSSFFGENSWIKEFLSWDFSEYSFLCQIGSIFFILLFMAIFFWISRWMALQML